MGGSIGDSVSPIVVGILLGGLTVLGLEWDGLNWRQLAFLMVLPALGSAAIIFLAYRDIPAMSSTGLTLKAYRESIKPLIKNKAIIAMTGLTTARAMAHNALNIFIVIYMSEDLGFSAFKSGYHLALLTLFGIGFAPAMGWAADRIGRRIVIFTGLASISVLIYSILIFSDGVGFTVVLSLLGLFLYSVNPVMLATAIDATKRGTEGSVTAIVFTGGAIFGSISPVLAGWLRGVYGMDSVFYFTGTIAAITTLASLVIPITTSKE